MFQKKFLFFLLSLLALIPEDVSALQSINRKSDKKPCIICIGQSNADGRVPIDSMPNYFQLPMQRCMVSFRTDDGSFQPLSKENFLVGDQSCFAFDLVVYHQTCHINHQPLYVIKHTKGGTSIDKEGRSNYHWTVDYDELENLKQSLFYAFEKQFAACKKVYGKSLDVRAVLWHQGEGDAVNDKVASRYYENLKKLVAKVRKMAGNKKLPFITGTISHRSTQYNALIEAAQRRLAAEDPHFYLVDMSSGTLLDPYHFDARSTLHFGRSVYNLLIESGAFAGKKIPVE